MKIGPSTLLACALCICSFTVFAESATHCIPGESTYFSCKLTKSNKVASLCGSHDLPKAIENDAPNKWLQYRFGLLESPEFVFPARKKESIKYFKAFWSQHKPISDEDTWGLDENISFNNGSAEYSIMIVRYEGEFYGVAATQGGKHTSLSCEGFSATVYGLKGDSNRKFYGLVRALPNEK